ncbi:hypothetical protein Gasu2_41180 [Galdieria sulphuraria]|nr:hypothetical protein Gasu2_41180 [Galdieria sulphuraria]
MTASYCFSSVASNYRRTMLLELSTYRIVQGLNISSFLVSFIASIMLFTAVISMIREKQQTTTPLLQLEKMKTSTFLIGAEQMSHVLLFLSCFHFTVEMNHNRIERNDHFGLIAFTGGFVIAALFVHKTISSLLRHSFWPIMEFSPTWLSFLVSVFNIFSDTNIMFHSIIVWEGNLQESWLLLPISTWYDTHDHFNYHSMLQQLGSLTLSMLIAFLLEVMKIGLLVRWQVCFVMTSYLSRFGDKTTLRSEWISHLFYRCLIVASWMGWSMILSLTLGTASFVSVISDYPFTMSWSSFFSIFLSYLSHWITILIYAVMIFAHQISPRMSCSSGATQYKWSKLKWLFVSFCIFLSSHPITRYFLMSWFPALFSTFKELLWITTKVIPFCYLSFILYDEAKPFIYLSFTSRQHSLLL